MMTVLPVQLITGLDHWGNWPLPAALAGATCCWCQVPVPAYWYQ